LVKTISELYLDARRVLLTQEDAQSASMMARNLLCHITGMTQEQILAKRDMYVNESVCQQMDAAVQRLMNDEPLPYVLGKWEFYGLELIVTPDVLIPRDDTCAVASLAIQQSLFLDSKPRILDLCTGSGCIGLAIASRVKDAKVTLADLSQEALAVAKQNIVLHHLTSRVSCVKANALEEPPAFLGKFDLIVSNPPYITTRDMLDLPHSVAGFEPRMALHGGDDGLKFYRAIAENYAKALKPGGYLCFEFGDDQGDDVCAILEANGYTILERVKDYNDRERAVMARYDRKEEE
jgi:release factor glutamine methyltransferase